jgi:hypothetical protein
VLGDASCRLSVCLSLMHTVNGGATWTHATVPGPAGTRGLGGLSGMQFADPLDGWAFGRTSWSTHDGAVSWSRLRFGGGVLAMAVAGGEAYALVDACGTGPCRTPARVERSPVGEDAWSRIPGATNRFSSRGLDLAAIGSTVLVLTRGSHSTTAIESSVGGAAFVSLPSPCQPPSGGILGRLWPLSLATGGSDSVAVACGGDGAAGDSVAQAFLSDDGGRTYVRLADPPTGGSSSQLALPSSTTVLLASGSALVRMDVPTQSWSGALTLSHQGAGISDLAFVDAQYGSLVDRPSQFSPGVLRLQSEGAPVGRLYVSVDGGASWAPMGVSG